MAVSEEIKILIDTQVGRSLSNITKVNIKLGNMDKSINKNNRGLKAFKDNWGQIAIRLGGVALALSKTVQAASNLEEQNSKLNTVFSDMKDSAQSAADALVDGYGLSTIEARKLLAATGDLLTGLGVSEKASLSMSVQVQELAADLASFNDLEGGATQASQALTSGLLGEREAMKSLGIVIDEAMIKQRLAAEGRANLTGMALRQAKAEVTLALALEQSKNALGDVARTSNSFANQQRQLMANLQSLAAVLGQILLPVINSVITAVNQAIKWFLQLDEGAQKLVGTVGLLGTAVFAIIPVIKTLGTALNVATSKLALIVLAIMAIVAASTFLINNWDLLTAKFEAGGLSMARSVLRFGQRIKIVFLEIQKFGIKAMAAMFGIIIEGTNKVIEGINAAFGKNIATIDNFIQKGEQAINKSIANEERRFRELQNLTEREKELRDEIRAREAETAEADDEARSARNATLRDMEAVHEEAITSKRKTEEIKRTQTTASLFQKRLTIGQKMQKVLRDNAKKNLEARLADFQSFSGFMTQNLDKNNKAQFAAWKAFKIAETIISTRDAAMKGYSAMAGIPLVGPVLAGAAFAAAIALGAQTVGKIAATPMPAAFEGALIQGTREGSALIAGERNNTEAVVPLDNEPAMEKLREGLGGAGGGPQIMINVENLFGSEDLPQEFVESIDMALFDLRRNNASAALEPTGQ